MNYDDNMSKGDILFWRDANYCIVRNRHNGRLKDLFTNKVVRKLKMTATYTPGSYMLENHQAVIELAPKAVRKRKNGQSEEL